MYFKGFISKSWSKRSAEVRRRQIQYSPERCKLYPGATPWRNTRSARPFRGGGLTLRAIAGLDRWLSRQNPAYRPVSWVRCIAADPNAFCLGKMHFTLCISQNFTDSQSEAASLLHLTDITKHSLDREKHRSCERCFFLTLLPFPPCFPPAPGRPRRRRAGRTRFPGPSWPCPYPCTGR